MLTFLFNINFSTLMFSGDIGHMVCNFYQLTSTVIGLSYNTFPRFRYVMLKPNIIFKSKHFAELCRIFHRLIVY